MTFNNRVLFTLEGIGLPQVWITETIFNTWLIMIGLTVFALIIRILLLFFNKIPTGFQNFVEFIIETMDNFVIGSMGEEYAYFANWFFGIFAFILCANLSGLIGMRPPTADLATTAVLGISTFLLIHFYGIAKGKGSYFKGYLDPNPVFLPLNIIGELAKPISLSFRLFGNILGGLIIMGMVYAALPKIISVGIPAALHVYFDLFSGCLQAFIFCILSMTFIREKIPE